MLIDCTAKGISIYPYLSGDAPHAFTGFNRAEK